MVRLNYDELRDITHKFKNEGVEIALLHTSLRDRMRDLHKDWQGEAADDFFAEMEVDMLPAVSRLAKAIFHAQDVLQKITRTIQEYDEDTKRFFNSDFSQMNPEHSGAAAANSWERMNRYEAWEANRKEFVYPDNQLQPEQSGDASDSAGRLVIANEVTGEVSTINTTTEGTTGSIMPGSSDEKGSDDKNGNLPNISSVTVEH